MERIKDMGLKHFAIAVAVIASLGVGGAFYFLAQGQVRVKSEPTFTIGGTPASEMPGSGKTAAGGPLPKQKLLSSGYHVFQTFNNCAAAGLSIALSYYDIHISQEKLAAKLRPNNNLQGLDDDKSTPPQELAAEAQARGLVAYHRGGGDIDTLKRLLAAGHPVLIRTLLNSYEDFAHYRVVRGYDEARGVIIQDDSYQGKDKAYTYAEWNAIWKPFNYAYVVLASPKDKAEVEAALGESKDAKASWRKAIKIAEGELAKNPNDTKARFNLATASFYLGDYERTVAEFEKVEKSLARRTMWYQMEPIEAYSKLGNHARVFSLSDRILNDGNRGYSELYLLKGKSYQAQGKLDLARAEYEKALLYHKNSAAAKAALASLQ
ncbi:MAG TPA: C39 family peptidase [Candidatus Paceibacterota bacterium]|nr:C39 family peptidase [Candidatus Paceibacterota bacterium]